MPQEINICYHLTDNELAKKILESPTAIPFLRTVGDLAKNPFATMVAPHVAVMEDCPEAGDILGRISELRRADSHLNIFIVSSDSRPEHIVEVMKAGATEFFLKPIDLEKFRAAIDAVQQKLSDVEPVAKGKVYSFIGSKGGLGTTVLAVNSAVALTLGSKVKAALLDMSLNSGDDSVHLDIIPKTTISDISKNFHRLDANFFKSTVIKHLTGLDFLAAPRHPEDTEEIHPEHVRKISELAKKTYDTVVVDCPSMGADPRTMEVFNLSDRIFVVTDLSLPAIRNASRLVKTMQKTGVSHRRIEIVVNRFVKGKANLNEIEKSINRSVFWLFPNDFDEIIGSINRGIPLVKYNPGANFSKNMMEFCRKLTNPQAMQDYRGMKGFLGRAI